MNLQLINRGATASHFTVRRKSAAVKDVSVVDNIYGVSMPLLEFRL